MPWKGERLVYYKWESQRKYAWSINYPACVECGTTDRAHSSHGLCVKCERHLRHKRLYIPHPRTPRWTTTTYALPVVWPYLTPNSTVNDTDLVLHINRILPTNLDEDVRAEAAQEMILAILEGRLALHDAAQAVNTFCRKAYRALREHYGAISLDRPTRNDDVTLYDLIPATGTLFP